MRVSSVGTGDSVHSSSKNFKGVDIKLGVKSINGLKPSKNLVILAHPDDETCFFGFIAKLFKKSKEPTQLIYSTSGQAGRDISNEYQRFAIGIRDKRLNELRNGINRLGAKRDALVLDMMDGETHFPHNRQILKTYVKKIIERTKPANIYTFDSSGITGHTDHFTIGTVTNRAVSEVDPDKKIKLWNIGFTQDEADKIVMDTYPNSTIFRNARASIDTPDRTVDISKEIPTLMDSFTEYKSQFSAQSCKDIKKFLDSYPFINMMQVK